MEGQGKLIFALVIMLVGIAACSVWFTAGPGERIAYYGMDTAAEYAQRPGGVQDALDRTQASAQPRRSWSGMVAVTLLVGVIALIALAAVFTPFLDVATRAMKEAKKTPRPSLGAMPPAQPQGYGLPLQPARPFPLPMPDQPIGALPAPQDEGVDWL